MIRHLAVVGATGAVGREVCTILEERKLRLERLSLLASSRSAGKKITVNGRALTVRELTDHSFDGVDYAIFSAGAERSRRFAPIAVQAGAVVVDNSSAFRMDPQVPLVVPEINPGDTLWHRGIIANPNCSTIIMNVAVWPLHRVNPVRRIVVSTYQSASGAGAAAMEELRTQTADHLAGRKVAPRVFPHPIAFNLFSHNTPIDPDGYNNEERKMIDETRKIFHDSSIAITATCIRVPVMRAHSEAINLTFDRPIGPDEVREILRSASGVEIVDDRDANRFPMPIDASGRDHVLVGRIRRDASQADGRGIDLFTSGDQLRKGAALNAVQIVELLANR
ncbi:MAG: aspartate-semialdehyde dehydrogenase [Phycisphaerales bacterium]|nr:aspartate-semialdehyde dehydrogenase [Phycisphaerales bacterium]